MCRATTWHLQIAYEEEIGWLSTLAFCEKMIIVTRNYTCDFTITETANMSLFKPQI